MKSELTPFIVFVTVVAVATATIAWAVPHPLSNLPIIAGDNTTIMADNGMTTDNLVVNEDETLPWEHHSPPSTIIEQGSGIETADFIIFHDDETPKNYYAKSGDNGEIVFGGTVAATVINNAITALGATGGAVVFVEGTYEITSSVNLASNVALMGQGAGTVLTLSDNHNANLDIIHGNIIDHALVANLAIDGNRATQTNRINGIHFDGVTHSKIVNCWLENMYYWAIYLNPSDNYNTIVGNTCRGNRGISVYLSGLNNYNTIANNIFQGNELGSITLSDGSSYNTITGNIIQGTDGCGINTEDLAHHNIITGNTCQGNGGITICISESSYNTVTGNTVQGGGHEGIHVQGYHNTIWGNTIEGNSQAANNTYDGIFIDNNSDYNNIQGNTIRRGTGDNKQRYGIRIHESTCDGTFVANNDLYDAGTTDNFSDAGTGTIFDYSQSGAETDLVPIDSTGLKENTITFPVSFPSAPRVTASMTNFDNDESIAYVVQIKTVTTDNFTIICNVVTASATAGHNADIYWHATVASQSGGRE